MLTSWEWKLLDSFARLSSACGLTQFEWNGKRRIFKRCESKWRLTHQKLISVFDYISLAYAIHQIPATIELVTAKQNYDAIVLHAVLIQYYVLVCIYQTSIHCHMHGMATVVSQLVRLNARLGLSNIVKLNCLCGNLLISVEL